MPNPRRTDRTNASDRFNTDATGWQRWNRFWFSAADVAPLAGLRLLFGLYLLFWLGGTFAGRHGLFGLHGWFDARAYREASLLPVEARPDFGWSPIYVAHSNAAVDALYFGALSAFAAFALGICVRATAVMSWLAIVAFTANPALGFGGDLLVTLVGFYLMFAYVASGWSGPREWRTWPLAPLPAVETTSVGANIGMRLLQVHLAIAVVACGSFKLQIGEWWAGDALWFPLFHPTHTSLDDILAWRQRSPVFLLSIVGLATYAMLAWQLAFPFLMWRRRWQPWMIGGALLGLLGNWFVYRLPAYGPVLLIGCLAYVDAATWRSWLQRLPHWGARSAAGLDASAPDGAAPSEPNRLFANAGVQ